MQLHGRDFESYSRASELGKPAPEVEQQKKEKPPTPVTGELVSVDEDAKTFAVKTASEGELKFSYSEKTVITGAEKIVSGSRRRGQRGYRHLRFTRHRKGGDANRSQAEEVTVTLQATAESRASRRRVNAQAPANRRIRSTRSATMAVLPRAGAASSALTPRCRTFPAATGPIQAIVIDDDLDETILAPEASSTRDFAHLQALSSRLPSISSRSSRWARTSGRAGRARRSLYHGRRADVSIVARGRRPTS